MQLFAVILAFVALVGAARHLTRLVASDDFDGRGAPQPVPAAEPAYLLHAIEGVAPRPTVLSHIGITVWNELSNVSALRWAAHSGIVRQFHAQRSSRCGSLHGTRRYDVGDQPMPTR